MSSMQWSDGDLREFLVKVDELSLRDPTEADRLRAEFHRAALTRLVVPVRERMLATVGVSVSAEGVAIIAREIVEYTGYWSAERTWLVLSEEPWEFLATWVTKRATKAYKATIGKGTGKSALRGIEEASSRRAITGPDAS